LSVCQYEKQSLIKAGQLLTWDVLVRKDSNSRGEVIINEQFVEIDEPHIQGVETWELPWTKFVIWK